MKIFLFFLEGNENCRVGTKQTGSVGLAETLVFFRPKTYSNVGEYGAVSNTS